MGLKSFVQVESCVHIIFGEYQFMLAVLTLEGKIIFVCSPCSLNAVLAFKYFKKHSLLDMLIYSELVTHATCMTSCLVKTF